MILYKANRDNKPFYSKNDIKSKSEWLLQLNLTAKDFDILASSDFDQQDAQLSVIKNINKEGDCISLTISVSTGIISDDTANSLVSSINSLLANFNS